MRWLILISSSLLIALWVNDAEAAVTVQSQDYEFSAPSSEDTLLTFDSATPKGISVVGGMVLNYSYRFAAQPAGDTSNYLAINSKDPATISSKIGYRGISFYWGSIDNYNTVSLLDKSGNPFASYTGSQITSRADGDQSSPLSNRLVNFTTSGSTSPIYGVKLTSSSPALEIDNFRFVAAVPETATWGMIILGFGVIGAVMRKQKKTSIGGSLSLA